MKHILSTFVFIILSYTTFAQTSITGRVLDAETREGEVAAIAQLLRDGSSLTYTITDSTGHFLLKTSATGSLTVKIENMGRKTVEREITAAGSAIDLGEILLENDTKTLESSSISALRTLVKIDADRLSYDVEHDIDAKSLTALDLLRKVPMVTVDAQDNITVNGSSSFKVYVDGRPNQMLTNNPSQMFKVMPASSIKSIEVVTNPGAKYDAEGAGGILDIKTMSGSTSSVVQDGVYGTVMAGIDTRGRMDGGLSINAQKGKWTFGANVNGMREHFGGVENFTNYSYETTSTIIDSRSVSSNEQGGMMSSLSVSFEPDSLNLFTASAGFNRFAHNSTVFGARTDYIIAGEMAGGYDHDAISKGSWNFANASLDWQHSFAGNRDKTLTVSYQFSGTPMTSDGTNSLRYDDGRQEERTSTSRDINSEHTLQTDFTSPVGKNQTVSAGLKYIFRHNSADDAFNGNPSIYDYYNHIGAAYTEYTATIKQFVLTAGLRYEHTFQKVDYAEATKNFDINYGNLVPNASVQWNLSQAGNLSLSYNMRIRRPGINSLNPYVEQLLPTEKNYGNPDVRAQKNHRISFGYNLATPKLVLSLKLAERFSRDGISEYSFYEDGVLNHTYGNIVNRTTSGLDIYANYNLTSKTRVYVNGDVDYTVYKSDVLGQRNQGWGMGMFAGFQTSIFWDMRLSLNTFIRGNDYELQGYSKGMQFGMLGLTKTFFDDKLSVSVQGVTPLNFGKLEIQDYSWGEGWRSDNLIKIPVKSIGFNISYSFGNGQMFGGGKHVRRSIENDDVEQNSNGGGISVPGVGEGAGL